MRKPRSTSITPAAVQRSTISAGLPGFDRFAHERVLGDLDERLAAHQWLADDAFSLADLAWSIDIHRFELIKFPMERYTAMLAWYRRIESLPSFRRMVLDYEAQFRKSKEAPKTGAA